MPQRAGAACQAPVNAGLVHCLVFAARHKPAVAEEQVQAGSSCQLVTCRLLLESVSLSDFECRSPDPHVNAGVRQGVQDFSPAMTVPSNISGPSVNCAATFSLQQAGEGDRYAGVSPVARLPSATPPVGRRLRPGTL